jgi:hypothetical protein
MRRALMFGGYACLLSACGGDPGDLGGASERATETTAVANQAVVASTKLLGYAATSPGADYNRCVPNAAQVLDRLNARGELLGFHYSAAGYTGLNGEYWHAQTVLRLPFYSWDTLLRGQFFVSSFSHIAGTGADNDSHLGVARLGFRGGHEGEAVGSNRMYNYANNGTRADWDVTPNPGDTFIALAGTPKFKIDELENHPGGMSGIGWHVVVPVQKWHYDNFWPGGETSSDSNPYVKIYDLWSPDWPVLRSSFLTRNNGAHTDNMSAAITKLADGRFLLAVAKNTPVQRVEFYVSTGTNLDAADVFGTNGRLPDFYWSMGGPSNFNFITDCNGDIYMIGLRGGDEDWIDLNRIDFYTGGTYPHGPYEVVRTFIGQKHMYCSDNRNTDQCDFQAGAGAYVDPNGHVLIYGVNYSNDGGATSWVHGNGAPWYGSYAASQGYLRGIEFRERHGNAAAGTACLTLDDAWVEFYEHPTFNSGGGNSGQVYRVDYADRDMRNARDLGTNYFNDKTSSLRWCLPAGHSIALYRDPWSGPIQYLNGSGNVRYMTSLSGLNYAYGGGSTNDSITAYWFVPNYVDASGWYGTWDSTN